MLGARRAGEKRPVVALRVPRGRPQTGPLSPGCLGRGVGPLLTSPLRWLEPGRLNPEGSRPGRLSPGWGIFLSTSRPSCLVEMRSVSSEVVLNMTWPSPFGLLFVLFFLPFSLFFSLLEQQLFPRLLSPALGARAKGGGGRQQLRESAELVEAARRGEHRHWTRNATDCLCSSFAFLNVLLSFWAGLPLPRRREESENGETRRRRRRTGSKREGREDGTRHLGKGYFKESFQNGALDGFR